MMINPSKNNCKAFLNKEVEQVKKESLDNNENDVEMPKMCTTSLNMAGPPNNASAVVPHLGRAIRWRNGRAVKIGW